MLAKDVPLGKVVIVTEGELAADKQNVFGC